MIRTILNMAGGSVAGLLVVVGVVAAFGFTPPTLMILGGIVLALVALLVWLDHRERYWRAKARAAAVQERPTSALRDSRAVLGGCDETADCPADVHSSRCWRGHWVAKGGAR